MRIPKGEKKLIEFAKTQIDICEVSQGTRAAAYRQYAKFIETGRNEGGMSLANELFAHVERLSSFLFCPTDVRFGIDFEQQYPQKVLLQAAQAARKVTRDFGIKDFDLTYSQSVFQALGMGACILKLTGKTELVTHNGQQMSHLKDTSLRMVPPWMFGVENEGKLGLGSQEAMCETVYLSKHDVLRRIMHLPEWFNMWKRIQAHSSKSGGAALPNSFIQVLSTSQISLNAQGTNPPNAGGIVAIAGDPSFATTGPQLLDEQFEMKELWVWDDETADYLMIQIMLPDVLISPRMKRINEFCPDNHPYMLVQPNEVPGYFWGRSEIVDLMNLQTALSETMDDVKRLIGLQYDGRYGFEGYDGDPQELYEDLRNSGYINGRQGTKVTNMTPELPAAALEYIKLLREIMNDVSGFGNILSGQGEAGVRAGNHASTLVKTASPRLRDRSLIVERQYAKVGDKYLAYLEAKDATQYCYDEKDVDNTSFLLSQIPDDRRVTVDSHSSSPIYEQDNAQLATFGLKAGLIDGEDAIDMLPFRGRDELKRKWRDREKQKAEFIAQHPELLAKGAGKK